tara:strand:+ start:2244 stop:2714 length:471 start_codon:yes stop_codon:yes gene_type:complete
MIVSFSIKAKPFSVNKAYYKNRQLTQEARAWREDFLLQLQKPEVLQQIQLLKQQWCSTKHALLVSYDFFYPLNLLLTKKGEVSKRSMDLTNIEKLVQDNLFEHRYNGREIDGIVIENFDIDDKFIVSLQSRKLGHNLPHHEILITVQLCSLESLQL